MEGQTPTQVPLAEEQAEQKTIIKGWGLPHQARFQVQPVQRCP